MTRQRKWELSKKIKRTQLRAGSKSIFAWDCSYHRCRAMSLRLTPSGVWCQEHYLGQPTCPVCGEEPILHIADTNGLRICRNCWQDTLPIIPYEASYSMICGNNIYDYQFDTKHSDDSSRAIERPLKPMPKIRGGDCYKNKNITIHVFGLGSRKCQCGAKLCEPKPDSDTRDSNQNSGDRKHSTNPPPSF